MQETEGYHKIMAFILRAWIEHTWSQQEELPTNTSLVISNDKFIGQDKEIKKPAYL